MKLFPEPATGLLLLAMVAGCAATVADPPPPPEVTRQASMSATLSSVTEAVLRDAAARTALDASSLVVESAQVVTWSDASLGCPQPGMSYAQVLTPGFRIVIRAGAQRFDYHAGRRGDFVLCPQGSAVPPAGADTT